MKMNILVSILSILLVSSMVMASEIESENKSDWEGFHYKPSAPTDHKIATRRDIIAGQIFAAYTANHDPLFFTEKERFVHMDISIKLADELIKRLDATNKK